MVAGALTSSRAAILGRVRAAIEDAQPEPVTRSFRLAGTLAADARTHLFCERVGEYRAEVHRVAAADVAVAVGAAFDRRRARAIVVPAGLPARWRPDGVEIIEDSGLGPHELDVLDGVLTGCTLAIAETGTIVLSGSGNEGRRALTLIPDVHVCVVEERQIVELVPEAIAALGPIVAVERRPVTFISGPSATSDIELSRVEGVHGPRDLVVLVVSPPPPTAP
jgi:L-lactate dehydrogenase complex protein LldG